MDRYQQISRLRPLSHLLGVLLWLDGLRSIVTRSSSSIITSPSLIPPSGTFCFPSMVDNGINRLHFCSGDWASGVWSSSGIPGQEQSCAARTGYATCEDFVRNSGQSFQNACELLSVSWRSYPWLTHMGSFQTGKSNHTSDTRRTRHHTHASSASSFFSFPAISPFIPPHVHSLIALYQVNNATKFKPLYSLVHVPSSRYPYHYRVPSLSGRLSAGHLYLTTNRFA